MYIVDYGIARVNPARAAQGQVPYEFPPRTGSIWRVTGMAVPTTVTVSGVSSGVGGTTSTNVAPGGIITITGTNLATDSADLRGMPVQMLPTSLGGVQVTIAGRMAPLFMVSPSMVLAQVPFEVAPGSQPVLVTSETSTSTSFSVTVTEAAPALFSDAMGGIVLKAADFSRVNATNPARAGEILVVYSTGLGQTNPSIGTGRLVPSGSLANSLPVTARIGGQNAEVISSVAAPGFAGLYQTAVRVPAGVTGAAIPLTLNVGNASSAPVNIMIAGATGSIGAASSPFLHPDAPALPRRAGHDASSDR
jgi:uncharacterized protein (TIGR03437 family)